MEIYVISVCRKQFYQLKTVDITKSTKIEISKRTDNSFSVKGPFKGPFVGPFFLSTPSRHEISIKKLVLSSSSGRFVSSACRPRGSDM